MTKTVAVSMNRLPPANVERLGPARARKAGEASGRNAMAAAKSDSRIAIVRRSETAVDKADLQTIGLLLVLATLFVIGAGAFAVRHQLAADPSQVGAGLSDACSGCAVVSSIMPCNFLM